MEGWRDGGWEGYHIIRRASNYHDYYVTPLPS